jgi:hypothetical protein
MLDVRLLKIDHWAKSATPITAKIEEASTVMPPSCRFQTTAKAIRDKKYIIKWVNFVT